MSNIPHLEAEIFKAKVVLYGLEYKIQNLKRQIFKLDERAWFTKNMNRKRALYKEADALKGQLDKLQKGQDK